ncbi:MAG: hypothetical protein ACSHXY_12005 [Alphaproteobacteria bacterium]
MTPLNLNKRIFKPVINSKGGTVNQESFFVFRQDGKSLMASYSGGEIERGHIVGQFETNASASLLYHCLTKRKVLKSGKANAWFTQDSRGRIVIDMEWEWLSGDSGKGISRYEEMKTNDT